MLNRIQGVFRANGGVPSWTRASTGGPDKPTRARRVRLSWDVICADCHGRWVALSECRYDQNGKAVEAVLVDTDDVLSDLCERVQDVERPCDIIFCS